MDPHLRADIDTIFLMADGHRFPWRKGSWFFEAPTWQDLNTSPHVTFFRTVYQRHTNFALEAAAEQKQPPPASRATAFHRPPFPSRAQQRRANSNRLRAR